VNIYLVNGVSTKVHGFKIEPNNLACQKSPCPSHPFLTESPELLAGYSQHILPRLPRCFRGVQTGLRVVRDSIIGYRASKLGFVVESGRVWRLQGPGRGCSRFGGKGCCVHGCLWVVIYSTGVQMCTKLVFDIVQAPGSGPEFMLQPGTGCWSGYSIVLQVYHY
jgi:hypothetical protein